MDIETLKKMANNTNNCVIADDKMKKTPNKKCRKLAVRKVK